MAHAQGGGRSPRRADVIWVLFITLMSPEGQPVTSEFETESKAECVRLGEFLYRATHAQAYQCLETAHGKEDDTRNRRRKL